MRGGEVIAAALGGDGVVDGELFVLDGDGV